MQKFFAFFERIFFFWKTRLQPSLALSHGLQILCLYVAVSAPSSYQSSAREIPGEGSYFCNADAKFFKRFAVKNLRSFCINDTFFFVDKFHKRILAPSGAVATVEIQADNSSNKTTRNREHRLFYPIAQMVFWVVCFFIGCGIGYLPKDRPFKIRDFPHIPAMILERLKDYREKQKQKNQNQPNVRV
jgi:hypothetical protein